MSPATALNLEQSKIHSFSYNVFRKVFLDHQKSGANFTKLHVHEICIWNIYLQIYYSKLTLCQSSPGFYMSAVQVF